MTGVAPMLTLASLFCGVLHTAFAMDEHDDDHGSSAYHQADVVSDPHYNPLARVEPFDLIAREIDTWMKGDRLMSSKDEDPGDWKDKFCGCMENGNLASWYQMASAMYIIHACNPSDGFILRTGHIQDRYELTMQQEIACDVLRLTSYCIDEHIPEGIPLYNETCMLARYTVKGCTADCNAAAPCAGGGVTAVIVTILAAWLITLLGA